MHLGGDAIIPLLEPWGLDVCPGRDDDDPTWRQRWFAWRDGIKAWRVEQLLAAEHDPQRQALLKKMAAADVAVSLCLFAWLEEPRPRKGEDKRKPFIPFAAQIHLAREQVKTWEMDEPRDIIIEKARGWGATQTLCWCALHMWTFVPYSIIGFLSRTEKTVDKPYDRGAIFGKVILMLSYFPKWLKPKGFDLEDNKFRLMLFNPENEAYINGDSTTDDAYRGNRAMGIVIDEAAFLHIDLRDVWATLAGASDHRTALSSANISKGRAFYDMANEARKFNNPDVRLLVRATWDDPPWQDDAWRERELERWRADGNEKGFYREYDIQYFADTIGLCHAIVERCPDVYEGYVADNQTVLHFGLDPGMREECAISFFQFVDGRCRWVDAYQNQLRIAEFYAHILTGIPPEPGDAAYAEPFTKRDQEIMRWLRGHPWHLLKGYMDPAGSQIESAGLSFVEILIRESRRLRRREVQRMIEAGKEPPPMRPIAPYYEDILKHNQNSFPVRIKALNELLMISDFTMTPGAQTLKRAIGEYRWGDLTPRSTRDPAPLHDESSHLTTSAQYGAVYAKLKRLYTIRERIEDVA